MHRTNKTTLSLLTFKWGISECYLSGGLIEPAASRSPRISGKKLIVTKNKQNKNDSRRCRNNQPQLEQHCKFPKFLPAAEATQVRIQSYSSHCFKLAVYHICFGGIYSCANCNFIKTRFTM